MRLFEKAANDLILVSISVALPQLKANLAWLFEQDLPAITLRFQQEVARFHVPLRCRSSLARLLFLPLPDVRICPGYRTMKTPDSAIRALRFEADEKARRVADLEQMIREFEQVASDLERQIKAEEDRTGVRDTTLIKTLLGLVRPDAGKIFINRQQIGNDPAYREHIGYMPQLGRYPDNMRVGQLFTMMKDIRMKTEAALDTDLLVKFNLASIFDKPMRTLSGGTRQKVSTALAFYFNPDILILDEPTAGLDPLSSEILKAKIIEEKQKNKLILITSHILSDLDDLTTHVMYLQEGKMIFLKGIEQLRKETGEEKLGKAIARIMNGEKKSALWIDEVLMLETNNQSN